MDLIEKLLFGTIILLIIACVVIFFVRPHKKHEKEISNNKREKDLAKQEKIGRNLEKYLRNLISRRKYDRYVRYVVNCYPNNKMPEACGGDEIFTLVIKDDNSNLDCYQISISVEKESIRILNGHNKEAVCPLSQMPEVKNMLREYIEAL